MKQGGAWVVSSARTEETLARYLSDPQDVVPGNRMPFGGLATPEESKDVVSYLESLK